jgi:hypothetical protein
MKTLKVYDKYFEESTDGFIMLQNWLLPKFAQALREKYSNYRVFDSMLWALEAENSMLFPIKVAVGLAFVNGQFELMAEWMHDLYDFIDDPDDFNKEWEQKSFCSLIIALRDNSSKIPEDNPSLLYAAYVTNKYAEHGKQRNEVKK